MTLTRVLVVDDEESYTRLCKLVLEDTGQFEVRVENAPEEALDVARGFDPDVAILDVIMPKMSGLEVASPFKEDRHMAEKPIIFLTATASRNHPAQDHELLRQCPVLSKPIRADRLVQSIEEALTGRG